ncbi:YrrC family ATP-dependent DNA helicase, partial [Luoshenia tenuis]|uniref:YrrC family ATP-dependent DNA helicase n=1 Tax=Luoshenia tenuis TaxID=2763654 RepID=UPI003D93A77B
MAELEGMVAEIVYRNEDNGFTVMEVACGQESVTAVGSIAFLQQGEQVHLWGYWVEHPEY